MSVEILPASGMELMPGAAQNGPGGDFAGGLENILQEGSPQQGKAPGNSAASETACEKPLEEEAPDGDTVSEDMGAAWQALLMLRSQTEAPPDPVQAVEEMAEALDALPDEAPPLEALPPEEPPEELPEEFDMEALLNKEVPEEPPMREEHDAGNEKEFLREPTDIKSPPPDEEPMTDKPKMAIKTEEEPVMKNPPLEAETDIAPTEVPPAGTESPQPTDNAEGEKPPFAGILEGVENQHTMEGDRPIHDLFKDLGNVEVTVSNAPDAPEEIPMEAVAQENPEEQILAQDAAKNFPDKMVEIDVDSLENARNGQSKSIFTAQQEPTEEASADAVSVLPENDAQDTGEQEMAGDNAMPNKKSSLPEPTAMEQASATPTNSFSQINDLAGAKNQQTLQLKFYNPDMEVADQLVQAADFALQEDKQEVRLRLAPESLGEVHITLTNTTGGVMAKILAENPETQRLLSTQLYQLEEQLKVRGVEVIDMEVSNMPDMTQQESFQGSWQGRQARRASHGARASRIGMNSYDLAIDQEATRMAARPLRDTSSVEFSA